MVRRPIDEGDARQSEPCALLRSLEKEARRLTPETPRRRISSGTIFVVALGVCMFLGWVLYQPFLPARWLHDFAGEIAARAKPDPTPPAPEDVRQVQRRDPPDHPFICAANVIQMPWDRMIVVTAAEDVAAHPLLMHASWGSLSRDDVAARMRKDQRYQLIVLLEGDTVVDAQLFFTFWGDLSAIARPDGYARAAAIFTAYSDDGIYFVEPATDVPAGICDPH